MIEHVTTSRNSQGILDAQVSCDVSNLDRRGLLVTLIGGKGKRPRKAKTPCAY